MKIRFSPAACFGLLNTVFLLLFCFGTLLQRETQFFTIGLVLGSLLGIVSLLVPGSVRTKGLSAAIIVMTYMAPVLLSLAVNAHDVSRADYQRLLGLAATFCACIAIGAFQGDKVRVLSAQLLAVVLGVLNLYLICFGAIRFERLRGFVGYEIQPNYIGLIAVCGIIAAFAFRTQLALPLVAVNLWTCVLAQSRTSILAAITALVVVVGLSLFSRRWSRGLLGAIVVLAVVVLLIPAYYETIESFVKSDVMLTDSKQRGLESGATGRTEVWALMLGGWQESPIFGQGFSVFRTRHEGTSTDGGYFLVLAEMGLAGMAVTLAMCCGCMFALWRRLQDGFTNLDRVHLACLVCFMVYNIFESRFFNGANPLSLFFYVMMGYQLAIPIGRANPSAAKQQTLDNDLRPVHA